MTTPTTHPATNGFNIHRLLPWVERHGILLLAGYFLVMGLLRPLVSSALEFDEAEQMLQTQRLLLGYGAQPPLFTWLMYFLFKIDGPSILALALLKNGLLFLSTLFLFLASRRIFGHELPALTIALSFLIIPQFAWESQRTLTDSVLVTTCASATFYLLVRIQQEGQLTDYIWLGLALGLGALSKYSFALFAPLLLGAALLTSGLRAAILDRRMLLTLMIAAVLVLPHALWILEHWEAATSPTIDKMKPAPDESLVTGFFIGWGNLALTILFFLTPLWIFYLWAGRPPHKGAPVQNGAWRTFFLKYALLLAIGMSLLMLITHATSFRDRWLQPFLALAPLAFMLFWPLSQTGARRLVATALAMMILWFVLLNTRALISGALDKPGKLNTPIEHIALELHNQGWIRGLVIVENIHLAGGLRLHLANSNVLKTGRDLIPESELRRECDVLLAWDNPDQPEPPISLSSKFSTLYGRAWNNFPHKHASFSAPILYGTRIYTLHTIHIRQACTP